MWCALPPSPLPFNFPRSPCSLRRRIRSPISARAALLPYFFRLSSKKQEGASSIPSSHPCSLSLMQMESRSDLFLPLSSLFRSFIRRRRVTIISTFGYRFCALHPPFLDSSLFLSLSLPASPPLLGEIDESAPTNRRRTAAFSDNRERKLHLLFLDLERNPQPETRETATYSFYKYD